MSWIEVSFRKGTCAHPYQVRKCEKVGGKVVVESISNHATREEAELVRDETRKQLGLLKAPKADPFTHKVETTILTLSTSFFKEREKDGFRRVEDARNLFKNWVGCHPIALIPIHQLTKFECQKWLNWLEKQEAKNVFGDKKTLSHSSVKNARNVLKSILDVAVKALVIPSNPCVSLLYKQRPKGEAKEKKNAFGRDEIVKLCTDPKIPLGDRILFQFAIYSGLRTGEIQGLHLSDIHYDCPEPYITVRYTVNEDGELNPPKNGKIENIPLLHPAIEAIKLQLLQLQGELNLKSVLFPQRTLGGYWHGSLVNLIDRALEKVRCVGILPGLPFDFHSMRRTAATGLTAGWLAPRAWTLQEAQSMLRHASQSTTERYARHGSTLAQQAAGVSGSRVVDPSTLLVAPKLQKTLSQPLETVSVSAPPA